MITVFRKGTQYGPYEPQIAKQYMDTGLLLPTDLAKDSSVAGEEEKSLKSILEAHGFKDEGNFSFSEVSEDIKSLSKDILWPWQQIQAGAWMKDKSFQTLMFVGLLPIFALVLVPTTLLGYIAVALYASVLWAFLFHDLFQTQQVENKLALKCFLMTAFLSIPILFVLSSIPPISWCHQMIASGGLGRVFGMFFGVGLAEEFCKLAVVLYLLSRPGSLLIPRTAVFYGMISGLGFGIYEGVQYQLGVNRQLDVDSAFFLNVLRLTSLPFLHAIWAGISAYFASFALLFPKMKKALLTLALGIPALLHTAYNLTTGSFLCLIPASLGLLLLWLYLGRTKELELKLRQSRSS
jgi:protease PrsW